MHDDGSRHWKGVITRGPDTYIQYTNDMIPTFAPDSYQLSVESALELDEKSKLYPIFCSYGCFNKRTLSAKLYVDKATPYKFSLDVDVKKDDEHVFTVDLNSRNNPKVFKLVGSLFALLDQDWVLRSKISKTSFSKIINKSFLLLRR